MKAPAFQFYPDDFVGGVADMTQAEVGAYILLLCAQWGRGSIPTDPERAALIAKGPVPSHVMSKFPNGKNARLERVRSKQEDYRAAQAGNGALGAAKRWHRHSDAIATPSPNNSGAMISPMARNSSPSPTPSPISDSTFNSNSLSNHNPPASPAHDPALIEAIYSLYPRKQAKQHALKAIRAALKVSTAAHLTERVQAYAEAVSAWSLHDRQFVPHPATWFNAGSYDDDPQTWQRIPAGANRHQMPAATKADHAMNNGGWGPNQ